MLRTISRRGSKAGSLAIRSAISSGEPSQASSTALKITRVMGSINMARMRGSLSSAPKMLNSVAANIATATTSATARSLQPGFQSGRPGRT